MFVCKNLVTPETTPADEVAGARQNLGGIHWANLTLEVVVEMKIKR